MKKLLTIIVLMLTLLMMSGCIKSSFYSENTHIKRVKKIIEEKYVTDNITYKLRPLYDNNDKLSYFVVDFSNNSYFYIKIQEKYHLLDKRSMYIKDTTGTNSGPWQKSKFVEENGKWIEQYEKDEYGNDILYYNSHFEVANIDMNTKCYLIKDSYLYNNLIPSIKVQDKYLSLVTDEEFNYSYANRMPNSGISFLPKSFFYL